MKTLGIVISVVLVLVVGFVFIVGLARVSYSQYEDAEDQQISQMSSGVEKEIQGEEAESKKDMGEMDETMRGNAAPLGVADYE